MGSEGALSQICTLLWAKQKHEAQVIESPLNRGRNCNQIQERKQFHKLLVVKESLTAFCHPPSQVVLPPFFCHAEVLHSSHILQSKPVFSLAPHTFRQLVYVNGSPNSMKTIVNHSSIFFRVAIPGSPSTPGSQSFSGCEPPQRESWVLFLSVQAVTSGAERKAQRPVLVKWECMSTNAQRMATLLSCVLWLCLHIPSRVSQ